MIQSDEKEPMGAALAARRRAEPGCSAETLARLGADLCVVLELRRALVDDVGGRLGARPKVLAAQADVVETHTLAARRGGHKEREGVDGGELGGAQRVLPACEG